MVHRRDMGPGKIQKRQATASCPTQASILGGITRTFEGSRYGRNRWPKSQSFTGPVSGEVGVQWES